FDEVRKIRGRLCSKRDMRQFFTSARRQRQRDLAVQGDAVDVIDVREAVSYRVGLILKTVDQTHPEISTNRCSASWVISCRKSDSNRGPSTSYSPERIVCNSPNVRGCWIKFQTRAPTGFNP